MVSDVPDSGQDQDPAAAQIPPTFDVAASAVEDGVSVVTQAAASAGEEAANTAQRLGRGTAQAYATASSDTAHAFEQARSRLQQLGMPGLDVGKTMFEQLKQNTDQASQQILKQYGQNAQALAAFNAKALDAWRANAEAAIAHWQNLSGVTNLSELMVLNTAHARKQVEAMTAQARELTEIAGQLARQAASQVRSKS